MKNQLAVSSFSLRDLLGPIHLQMRGPDGKKAPVSFGDRPVTLPLLNLAGEVKRRTGITALEICQFHVADGGDGYLHQLKGALAAEGVSVVNMPIDVGNISSGNAEHREEDLAEIEGWIRFASRLGSAMVRVNASGFRATDLAPLDVTIASFRRLGQFARAHGMQLTIENHGGITDDFNVILQIVAGVGDGLLKTCVDLANHPAISPASSVAFTGKAPPATLDAAPLYRDLPLIARHAAIVHAKNPPPLADGSPAFDGERALAIVRDVGFTGPISLELGTIVGDPWDVLAQQRALVEKVFA